MLKANTNYQINSETFENLLGKYNYTYWDQSNSGTQSTTKYFTNHTDSYGLSIDYTNLNINSLNINSTIGSIDQRYKEANSTTFPTALSGNITYSVLQNGVVTNTKTTSPTQASGEFTSQLADFGTFCNRRFIEGIGFTNNLAVDRHFTGIDFINWNDRFSLTFRLKPTTTIINGQLQLSVTIPSVFSTILQSGNLKAFVSNEDNGFVVKGGSSVATTTISGNTITITTASTDLIANNNYNLALIFYAVKKNLTATFTTVPDSESLAIVSANATLPSASNVAVDYNNDEGTYFITVPNYNFGYTNCNTSNRLQNIKLLLQNNTSEYKKIRLCFKTNNFSNIVGFTSMIRTENGDPSGLPLQISKNWHGTTTSHLYGGTWVREYTELIIPPNTKSNLNYTRVGAKWGNVYAASSHQLSIVGYGTTGGYSWLEAALGSSGESITHSPDYSIGNANVCDYRPFLVTNQAYGGTSQQCSWTGNVGGMDFGVYFNSSNTKIYQTQNKIRFHKYGPNLTETSYSGFSSDNKLKLDYTFYLSRSDDYLRVFYKIKIKALQNIGFTRLSFFQLGADSYHTQKAQTFVYGNQDGITGTFTPTNSSANAYTTNAIPLIGQNTWLWLGDGQVTTTPDPNININTNNGIVIRSYKATFGGIQNNTPYFREYSVSGGFGGGNVSIYDIVPPPSVTSLIAGDEIEMLLETVILPKQIADYYGTNANFISKLTSLGNSSELLLREASKNKIVATSTTNVVDINYPLTVITTNNTARVTITGGLGYMPIVFSNLTSVSNPKLWKNDGSGWVVVDQSNYGKDFWQAEINPENGLFDLIYNVNQDAPNDTTLITDYYLGQTPP